MSGESPARDGGRLDRQHEPAAAPRASRSRRRHAVPAAAATAALLAGLAACASPAPDVTVHPPATSSQRLPLSPIPGQLIGVSAGPGGSAWAAGYTCTPGCFAPSEANQTLIMRWNGVTWSAG